VVVVGIAANGIGGSLFWLGFSEFSQRFEARFDCFSEKADLRRSK
jgi:hypothetical protein